MRKTALLIILISCMNLQADELILSAGVESGFGTAWEMVYDNKIEDGYIVPYVLSELTWQYELPLFGTASLSYRLPSLYINMEGEYLLYGGAGKMEDRDWMGLLSQYSQLNVDETVETHYSLHDIWIESSYSFSGGLGLPLVKEDDFELVLGFGVRTAFIQFFDTPIYKAHTSRDQPLIKDDIETTFASDRGIHYSMKSVSPYFELDTTFKTPAFMYGLLGRLYCVGTLLARDHHFYLNTGTLATRYDDAFINRFGGLVKLYAGYNINPANRILFNVEVNGFFPAVGTTTGYSTMEGSDGELFKITNGGGNSELNFRFGIEYVLTIAI